jgi:penicillin-binding protein 2
VNNCLVLLKKKKYEPLFRNPENIKFVQNAMFAQQMKLEEHLIHQELKILNINLLEKLEHHKLKELQKRQRELRFKNIEIPYNERDHALYVAFGPYKNPRYALSIVLNMVDLEVQLQHLLQKNFLN